LLRILEGQTLYGVDRKRDKKMLGNSPWAKDVAAVMQGVAVVAVVA
jgi:hypothetical protein